MEHFWTKLPDPVFANVLKYVDDIDTRLSFKMKPRKLKALPDLDIRLRMNTLVYDETHKILWSFERSSLGYTFRTETNVEYGHTCEESHTRVYQHSWEHGGGGRFRTMEGGNIRHGLMVDRNLMTLVDDLNVR